MDMPDFHAVYEHGVLKPNTVLPFHESENIHLRVIRDHADGAGFPEEDIYHSEILNLEQVPFTWDEVCAAFSKIPAGEIEADLRREREGRL